mgnify:CR=1 FL=1
MHDISVYTNWEKDTIRQGFDEENNLFYILTNSRGFTAEQTTKAHNEIAAVVDEVAKKRPEKNIYSSAEAIPLSVDIIHWRQNF